MGVACGSAFRRQFYIDSDCFGHRTVSAVRSSEVIRFSEVLNTLVLWKVQSVLDGCPFYRGRPLLGSAKRGFTVMCDVILPDDHQRTYENIIHYYDAKF